jgi:hypothetical protein
MVKKEQILCVIIDGKQPGVTSSSIEIAQEQKTYRPARRSFLPMNRSSRVEIRVGSAAAGWLDMMWTFGARRNACALHLFLSRGVLFVASQ